MKAYLLAGGRGERLLPLTRSTPKCLVPIAGRPLLGLWLDLLDREGVTDVLVNISHHVDQVERFLGERSSGPRVQLVVEEEPRGNAGTVSAQASFAADVESVWVFYADNLTNMSLGPMWQRHARHDGLLTMGLFHAPNPRAAGIVTLDSDGRIVAFTEKPEVPASDLANAGVYLLRREALGLLPPAVGVVDFGHHVFPRLLGRMYGHVIDAFLMDIGTPSALQAAEVEWARLPLTAPA